MVRMLTMLTMAFLQVVEPQLLSPDVKPTPLDTELCGRSELQAFADFVDRHLLLMEADLRGSTIRQRERVFSLGDDDIGRAFALVPEAQTLALQAQKNFRIARVLAGIGTGATLSFALLPLLLTVPPAIIATLVVSGLGLVTLMLAVPFQTLAQSQFTSAINMYNRALLDPSRREHFQSPLEPGTDTSPKRSEGATPPGDAAVAAPSP